MANAFLGWMIFLMDLRSFLHWFWYDFSFAPIVTSLYEYIWSPSVEIDFGIACPIHLTDKPFASWNSCTAFLDIFFVVPRVASNSSPGNAHSISNPSPKNGAKELSLNFYPKWISRGQRLGGKVCPFFSATQFFEAVEWGGPKSITAGFTAKPYHWKVYLNSIALSHKGFNVVEYA